MTAKEKAEELHKKMWEKCRLTMAGAYHIFRDLAKGLAIIAIDEILQICPLENFDDVGSESSFISENNPELFKEYWQQVKQEIEGL